VVGKMIGPFLLREDPLSRIAIGMAMTPRGEVGLIFAELGRVNDIYDNEIYAALVMVIALTTLLPPFALKWFYARYAGAM
jgi:Kef-type K+ transport system membrane component KefB